MFLSQQNDLSACDTEDDETGRESAFYQEGRLRGYTEPHSIRQGSWRPMPMMVGYRLASANFMSLRHESRQLSM